MISTLEGGQQDSQHASDLLRQRSVSLEIIVQTHTHTHIHTLTHTTPIALPGPLISDQQGAAARTTGI